VPVGVGVPVTAIVTLKFCAVVMLYKDGVTAIIGVVFPALVTATVDVPTDVL
jgi:hypothetical protein